MTISNDEFELIKTMISEHAQRLKLEDHVDVTTGIWHLVVVLRAYCDSLGLDFDEICADTRMYPAAAQ